MFKGTLQHTIKFRDPRKLEGKQERYFKGICNILMLKNDPPNKCILIKRFLCPNL